MTTQTKLVFAAILLVLGWVLIISAVPAYAFFWRVDNEPGARKIPELFWAAVCLLSAGGITFLVANVYLLGQKSKLIFIAWGLCLFAGMAACSLSPILLLFMV